MKTKHGVVSQIGLSLILAAILLYPFAFTATSIAQDMPDVIGVRFNDGTVIEGTVIKANTDIVTIRTKDGQIVTRKFSEVDNFIKTGESLKPSPRIRYEESPFYAGIYGGYVLTDKAKVEVAGESFKVDVDDSWIMGIKLGANIPSAPFCNLEVEYNHIFSSDVPLQTVAGSGANSLQVQGDAYLNNLMFNFVVRYPAGNFRPYLGAGIGWSHFETSGTFRAVVGGTTYNLPFDAQADAFAFQLMVGLNYRLDRNFSIDGGYRYFITEPSVGDFDIRYQANIFTLGLNYHFW
jgi:opacity protein-like surface antigen